MRRYDPRSPDNAGEVLNSADFEGAALEDSLEYADNVLRTKDPYFSFQTSNTNEYNETLPGIIHANTGPIFHLTYDLCFKNNSTYTEFPDLQNSFVNVSGRELLNGSFWRSMREDWYAFNHGPSNAKFFLAKNF